MAIIFYSNIAQSGSILSHSVEELVVTWWLRTLYEIKDMYGERGMVLSYEIRDETLPVAILFPRFCRNRSDYRLRTFGVFTCLSPGLDQPWYRNARSN